MDWWVVTGGLGLFFFVGGSLFVVSGRRFRREREPDGWWSTAGTIVDWEWIQIGSEGPPSQFPVIEYALPNGVPHRFRSRTTAGFRTVRRGQPVQLFVNPADPTDAQLTSSASTLRTIGCAHLVMGSGFAVVGALLVAGTVLVLWLLPQTR